MACRPWKHQLRIRLDRLPFVWQCRKCLQCWSGADNGRPVGDPLPVDPTVPIREGILKEANK